MVIFERLNRDAPGKAQFIRDQSRLYSKMSDMRSLVGDLQGALDWETRARDVREAWVKRHDEDRVMRRAPCEQSAIDRRTSRATRPL